MPNAYDDNTPKKGGKDVDSVLDKMGVFDPTGTEEKQKLDAWDYFRICTDKTWKKGVIAFIALVMLANACGGGDSDKTPSTTNSSSSSSQTTQVYNDSDTPSRGKAFFTSHKTNQRQEIGVKVSRRRGNGGKVVYDAKWADGLQSSYVFYKSGAAEVVSKDGAGKTDITAGTWKRKGSGVIFTSKTGSTTQFRDLSVTAN